MILGRKGVRRFNELCPALAFLESHLFRTGKNCFAGGIFYLEKPSDQISIHACANPREEAEFAARTHPEADPGAEACFPGDRPHQRRHGDLRPGRSRRVFPKYGIPASFIDETRRVLLNPFLEFMKAALEMLIRDYSYETVLRFLRCGLLDFAPETIDYVENYVLAAGIRGYSMWKKEWTQETRSFSAEDLPRLNAFRETFLEKTAAYTEAMRREKISQCASGPQGLYRFIAGEELRAEAHSDGKEL